MRAAHPRVVGAAALCLLAAALAPAVGVAAQPEVPYYPGRINITVCTTPFTPSECGARACRGF